MKDDSEALRRMKDDSEALGRMKDDLEVPRRTTNDLEALRRGKEEMEKSGHEEDGGCKSRGKGSRGKGCGGESRHLGSGERGCESGSRCLGSGKRGCEDGSRYLGSEGRGCEDGSRYLGCEEKSCGGGNHGGGNNKQVYLKLNQISEVQTEKVKLKDIAEVFCQDSVLLAKCNSMTVKVIHERREKRYIGDVLEIIHKISQLDPKAQVDNLGETDYIIDYRPPQPSRLAWQWVKTIFVCIISFCGAAFAIMTFNNDVDVPALFQELYRLVMGKESNGFTVLEASYSIGLSLGILVFFNHFLKWKLTADPTPIEVEMRTYEDDICKTLIQNNGRKEKEVDVT